MPLTVKCRECEHVLYSGDLTSRAGGHYHSPMALLVSRKYNGRCPNCNRVLKPSEARVIEVSAVDEPAPEPKSPFKKKKKGGRRMNLDESIIAFLKRRGGEVSRSKVWKHFNNYSKGYLYKRLRALKRSGLIVELGDRRGLFVLTERGWNVTIPELQQMNLKKKREETNLES